MEFIKKVISVIAGTVMTVLGIGQTTYVAPESPVLPKNPAVVEEKISTTTNQIHTTTKAKNAVVSTSTKPKAVEKKVATTTKTSIPTAQAKTDIIPQQSAAEPAVDFEKVNTYSRKAIVNILCGTKGTALSPISGTGVIINPKGIILTNAHIAQYFLLKDFTQKNFVECIIRTGSPAYPEYRAELMYLSSNWINENKSTIRESNPKGTGENDFALLRITERIDGNSLPSSFNFLLPDIRENISVNEPVLLISYPAGFLGGMSILQDLNITSSITNIQDVFTFKTGTIDVLSVGGTVISQKGSSGGAVIDKYSTLLGLISTSSGGESTSQRELNAITLAHINRVLNSELGFGLSNVLAGDPAVFAKTFNETVAPTLTQILINEIMRN